MAKLSLYIPYGTKFYSNKILWFGSKLFRLKVDGFQFNKAQFSVQCHASNTEDFHAVMDLYSSATNCKVKVKFHAIGYAVVNKL